MTQLEILNLAYHQLLAKRGYYCQRIEALKAEGRTNSILNHRKNECEQKISEIHMLICKEESEKLEEA